MTYYEALKAERRWHKRAIIVSLYHHHMTMKKKKWTMRLSAQRLGISLGMISESLKLANAILKDSELEKMSRADALRAIR